MKSKNEMCYYLFFNWLSSVCLTVKNDLEKGVFLDFKQSSQKQGRIFFKESRFYGCLFHSGQIVWRRVQTLKFSKEFIANYEIRFDVKMILALSFVREEEVLLMAAKLKSYLSSKNSKDVLRLFEWFYNEYLSNKDGNKV